MEKLQGPINPCLIGEDVDVGWLEEFVSNTGSAFKFEDSYCEEGYDSTRTLYSIPSLEDKMPFLQMLQGVELPAQPTVVPFMHEQNNYFQFLLGLQHQKMFLDNSNNNNNNNNFSCSFTSELDCSNDIVIKSETTFREEQQATQISPPQQCDTNGENKTRRGRSKRSLNGAGGCAPKERRKRKRPVKATTKNKEEVETQRMTHIAVERNRRRQMNDHLNALRSLMPPSYVQRGDQASIIGGAIDFVKEMEQLLQSLQAQKRMRHDSVENIDIISTTTTTSTSTSSIFMTSPTSPLQYRNFSPNDENNTNNNANNYTEVKRNNNNNYNNNSINNEEFSAENRSALADIKVVVIQNHVNLKIECHRRPGQLLKVILAFEQLRLTVLHLNITSLHALVHYSFNLKIEEDCKVGTAEEVVRAVHHIFSMINLS